MAIIMVMAIIIVIGIIYCLSAIARCTARARVLLVPCGCGIVMFSGNLERATMVVIQWSMVNDGDGVGKRTTWLAIWWR